MTSFLMAGGGTGGHVLPNIAVARELRSHGHTPVFIGTRQGMEARLAPAEGFPIEWIDIGGLNRVGLARKLRTLAQLPLSVLRVLGIIAERRPAAVFSMGGYAAGPVTVAAILRRLPVVLMEPNAVLGFSNRRIARFVTRALVSFPEVMDAFPEGRAEITGLPVRAEFFSLPEKAPSDPLHVLITGGSRGARRLNMAAREAWTLGGGPRVRWTVQTGGDMYEEMRDAFAKSGLEGEVAPFIADMPAAFAAADVVICRSGAGAVSELMAAGKPSLLVPFPFAADDHQLRNAEAMTRAGAARMTPDAELTGERLLAEIASFAARPDELRLKGAAARALGKPRRGAARGRNFDAICC